MTKLRLRECCFTEGTLANLLDSFSCVKVLEYICIKRVIPYNDMEWPPGRPTVNPPMPPDDISYAIGICKDTLEELYIDLRPWYGRNDSDIDESESMWYARWLLEYRDFEDFYQLKYLNVEAKLAPEKYDLPPNLESLVLRHCEIVELDHRITWAYYVGL
jgi:hypothetical protein